MAVDYIDNGNDDGTNFGRSDGKIGFYGLTAPIVQPDFTQAALATTAVTKETTNWGFADSSQPTELIVLANELRAKLVALNLVAT